MNDIINKLNKLDEFDCQKDSIEHAKREMLNEIKVPAEMIEVQNRANDLAQKYAASQQRKIDQLRAECAAKLAEIQIPPEVAEILKQIDHQRGMVRVFQEAQERDILKAIEEKRAELFEQAKRETEQVYKDLATRKAEIEAEFAGKIQDADANIEKLEAEIREMTKAEGRTVKGDYFTAVYNKGRITWNTDKMEAWIIDHPFLREARKEGEPSISIRRNK